MPKFFILEENSAKILKTSMKIWEKNWKFKKKGVQNASDNCPCYSCRPLQNTALARVVARQIIKKKPKIYHFSPEK